MNLPEPSRTQTLAVSEVANKTGHYPPWGEVKSIDRNPHWYSRRVMEAIHIRLHPNSINRDSGIEILKAWMPAIGHHDERPPLQRTAEGSVSPSHNAPNLVPRASPLKKWVGPTFRAEKRSAQASAHPLSQAQGGLFCVLTGLLTVFVSCWSSE